MKLCTQYLIGKHFTVGFVRWDSVDKAFLKMLSMMRNACDKVLMDFHGYFEGVKASNVKGLYTVYTTRWNGGKLKKYVDYGLTESKSKSLFGIDVMSIDTGIDVSKYRPHVYKGSKDVISMISVANERSYHGYDRIIRGLGDYYKTNDKIKVDLHLVGVMSEGTIKLVEKYGVKDHVYLHGYQTGEELERIYSQCNIGVGPLAPHRVGGKEGTGIKTKEYFAIGLPYFYAGNELLVPKDYPYVLKFDADETPINIKKITEFYNDVKVNKSNVSEQMRDFAREHFSWEKMLGQAFEHLGLNK